MSELETFDEGFSLVGAFAVEDDLILVDDLGVVDEFPFDDDGTALVADFSVRSFEPVAETVDESATDVGAVAGFTAGAHAQAMTIASSENRA